MALPQTLNSTTPQNSDSPAFGAAQIRSVKQFLVDVFGIQNNTPYTDPAFSIAPNGVVTFTVAPVFTQLAITQGTITTDLNALAVTGTWNNAGIAFRAIDCNITNTASAAGALLLDLRVGGTSQFKVGKAGVVTSVGALNAPTLNLSASSNQLVLQSAGVTGTLTWTPTSSGKTITFPDVSGTVITTGNLSAVTSSGTVASGTWNGTAIGAAYGGTGINTAASTGVPSIASGTWSVASTLAATLGGTGQSSFTTGDLLYASNSTTISRLAATTAGTFLRSAGASTSPTWSTLILPNAATTGDLLHASTTNTIGVIAAVAVGAYLRSNGVSAAPVWSTITLPNAVTTGDLLAATGTNAVGVRAAVATGSYLRSAGTGTLPVWSTLTLPNTASTGSLLAANATDAVSTIAAVATGQVLISQGTGTLPVWSANPSVTSLTVNIGTGSGTGNPVLLANSNATAAANVDAGETDLMSYSLPGNSMDSNGKGIRVVAFGSTAANGNGKTLKFYFGTFSIQLVSANLNDRTWFTMIHILRTGATTQIGVARYDDSGGGNPPIYLLAPTETLSGAVTIKFTGQGSVTNDITQRGMVVAALA